MKVIVLTAGLGTRLEPITDNKPKHLLEIGGKPILRRILDDLLEIDNVEIIIVVHHYKNQIENSIETWYNKNQINKITFVDQNSPKGTGHALQVALETNQIDEGFMVIYGDLILGNAIKSFIDAYKQSKDSKFSAILGVKVKNPSNYGVLTIENGKLLKIQEKPKDVNQDTLINGGVYFLPSRGAELVHQLQENSDRKEIELTDIIELLIREKYSFQIIEQSNGWFDIGRPWSILNANEFLLENEVENFQTLGIIEEGVQIHGKIHLGQNAKLRSGTYIDGNIFIDEGADIGPNCYLRGYTYIGKNVRIGNACEVKNSIIYHKTHAAHLSYIGDTVIGENTNLGAGTIIANLRHDNKSVKMTIKGKRESSQRRKLGSVIGDNVKIGIGASILPGVKISSNTWINSGKTIDRDC